MQVATEDGYLVFHKPRPRQRLVALDALSAATSCQTCRFTTHANANATFIPPPHRQKFRLGVKGVEGMAKAHEHTK